MLYGSRMLTLGLVSIAIIACGKKKDKEGGTLASQVNLAGTTSSLLLNQKTSSTENFSIFHNQYLTNFMASSNIVGQVTQASLKSFKYYVTAISICETMKTQGTSYSEQANCLPVFQGNGADANYTYSLPSAGAGPSKADYDKMLASAKASDTGYIDLMSATDRAKLGANIQLVDENAHSYNYGVINWYLPYKIKAEVPMYNPDGTVATTYRTNAGTTNTSTAFPVTTAATDFGLTTAASEAVLLFPNGGNWFKFQNPLVISDDDIKNKANFKLALVFNPDGLVKGYSASSGSTFAGCPGCNYADPTGNGIQTPMLGLIPIPFKEGQTVAKEVYQGKITGTAAGVTNNATIRLELYYVKEDPKKTIYGAQAMALTRVTDGVTQDSFFPIPNISFTNTNADSTIDFQLWDKSAVLSGFTRKSTKGDTTSLKVNCGDLNKGGWQFTGCVAGTPVSVALQLTDILDVAK